MPVSNDTWKGGPSYRSLVLEYIRENTHPNGFVLDVGPGVGTYAKLLHEYQNIDAVEIWEPYIEKYGLRVIYRNVYIANIVEFDFEWYDLVIMGDVLEHLSVEEAEHVLRKIVPRCGELLVGVPYECPQTGLVNQYEKHQQPDLTPDIFEQRYGSYLKLFARNEGYGYYIKHHYGGGVY